MNENHSLAQLAGCSWTEANLFLDLAGLDDRPDAEEAPGCDPPKTEPVDDIFSRFHLADAADSYQLQLQQQQSHFCTAPDASPVMRSLPQLLSPVRELQPDDDMDAAGSSLHLSGFPSNNHNHDDGSLMLYPHPLRLHVASGDSAPLESRYQQQPLEHQQEQQPVMIMNAGSSNNDLTQQEIDDILGNLVNNRKQIAAADVACMANAPMDEAGGLPHQHQHQQQQNEILVYASTASNNASNIGGGDGANLVTVNNSLMKYLHMAAPGDNIMVLNDQNTSDQADNNFNIRMKCYNCSDTFSLHAFEQHVCDYNEQHERIPDFVDVAPCGTSVSVGTQVSVGPGQRLLDDADDAVVPGHETNAEGSPERDDKHRVDSVLDEFAAHPVHKLLEANRAFVHKWLKCDYKLDLNAKPGDELAAAVSGNSKKADGPHVCDQCDRKFVHATGLARHLEKHDHEKATTTTIAGSLGSVWSMALWTGNGGGAVEDETAMLDTVTKCMLCLRVFRLPDDALRHLDEAHQCLLLAAVATERLRMDFSDSEEDEKDPRLTDIVAHAIKSTAAETAEDDDDMGDARHLRVIVVSSVLQCEYCDLLFVDMGALLRHSATHDPRDGYACRACDIRVRTVSELFGHWQRECPFERFEATRRRSPVQRYFVCNVCENKFESPGGLYEHRRTSYHLFPRQSGGAEKTLCFACAECGHLTETAKAAVAHQAEHQVKTRANARRGRDGDATTSASKAGGGGSSAGRAKATSTTETADATAAAADGGDTVELNVSKYRQYLCDVCGKSYTQSSHLWQHLRFHKGVKPFACKEPDCTRRFTIRPDLNDHIRKCHTGERPYHCQICGKRFLTGSVFYQHRLIHRGERRYGCDSCGKRFYRADALKNHQRIHTGEKPYACTQCQKKFRQRGDRDKHVRARHNGAAAGATGVGPGTTTATAAPGASGSRATRANGSASAAPRAGRGPAAMSLSGLPVATGGATRGAATAAGGGARGRIRSKKDLLLQPRPGMPMQQQQQQLIGNIPVGYTGGVNSRGRMPAMAVPTMVAPPMNLDDVVYVGDMAFPTSMFRPVVSDIDGHVNLF